MRHLMPVNEARHQLGGISATTFYALVKEGELSLVKIGRRSFVQAEELDDFVRRKRYDPSGQTEVAGRVHLPISVGSGQGLTK
jgi:excisionase family DNA binding protein